MPAQMTNSTLPVLIAGPTASGKSALALALARQTRGCIINADAIQVYDCWRVLSARPSPEEEAEVPHFLYGHIGYCDSYSTGQWLRDVQQRIKTADAAGQRPIIIGGTGLYFSALTQGLAEIPETPDELRAQGNDIRLAGGRQDFIDYLQSNDPETLGRIDVQNPARLQRAWEVHKGTGAGLVEWHRRTPSPVLPPQNSIRLVMDCDRDWLADRIDRRFDLMMADGALSEVQKVCDLGWEPHRPASQAIGARELVAHLDGELAINDAIERAKAQSRQYAKRQRTWFRNRMKDWQRIDATTAAAAPETVLAIISQRS
ncbi:MAG: tRNA (adenosine(37)-N6)-dimethylallyltransferase MiaA [Rhodobacteraceae bacterium]|nr:tRNA (adenosine(37)-N6)-dimethylallyltransferase MiaA [Paracoccaceae bacterium]